MSENSDAPRLARHAGPRIASYHPEANPSFPETSRNSAPEIATSTIGERVSFVMIFGFPCRTIFTSPWDNLSTPIR